MEKSVIKVTNLRKHFGKTKAVDGISFEVKKGEIFGFLGPNGAGKTTTINCLLDFIRPNSGEIEIFDKDIKKNLIEIKTSVSYLSGEVALYDKMKAAEYFGYILSLNKKPQKEHQKIYKPFVKLFNFEKNLNRKIKTLSRGNRQKVAVISALMLESDLLIMDEPTSGLDPLMQEEFYNILRKMKQKGKTIFMSSHFLPEIEKICDRAAIIKEGKIVAIEDIDELGKKGMLNVEFSVKEKLNLADFKNIKEISQIKQIDGTYQATVRGSCDKLIKALSKYTVETIEIKHADLEKVFMEFYND